MSTAPLRPQLVRASEHPDLHRVLTLFGEKTGTPVLINTSFNMHEEPLVRTPTDAIPLANFWDSCTLARVTPAEAVASARREPPTGLRPETAESHAQLASQHRSAVIAFPKDGVPALALRTELSGRMSHVHGQALHARAAEVNEADGPVRLDRLDDGDVSELVISATVLVAIPGVAEEGDVSDIGTLPLVKDAEILRLLVEIRMCFRRSVCLLLHAPRRSCRSSRTDTCLRGRSASSCRESSAARQPFGPCGSRDWRLQVLWLHDLRRYVGDTLGPHAAGGSGYAQPAVREASDE